MRVFIVSMFLLVMAAAKAQYFVPGSYVDMGYRGVPTNNLRMNDSTSNKKWSLSRYSSLSTTFSFFKGGSASVFAAPIGLQLNRRLTNNLYAFAGASLAPAYVSFRSSFLNAGSGKFGGAPFDQHPLGLYSRAELGLMYVNDEKTFSISGSIGIERSSNPYMNPFNNQQSNSLRAIQK